METKEFSKKQKDSERYARQSFSSLANFHKIQDQDKENWQFSEADVIAFLKCKGRAEYANLEEVGDRPQFDLVSQ